MMEVPRLSVRRRRRVRAARRQISNDRESGEGRSARLKCRTLRRDKNESEIVRNARSFATRTAPARAAHPAGTTTRRDGCLRRSRNNRPPRSPDAELDFAGTTALWTPPRWRWRSRLQAFRDGCVRTKGQAAASSLQARAKCSTAYWYEPNASGAPSNTNAVIVYCKAALFSAFSAAFSPVTL